MRLLQEPVPLRSLMTRLCQRQETNKEEAVLLEKGCAMFWLFQAYYSSEEPCQFQDCQCQSQSTAAGR